MHTHLFLFGGGPPFTPNLRKRFAALTNDGPVAILYVPRPGKDWTSYASIYTEPLEEDGILSFVHLPLSDAPTDEQLAQYSSVTASSSPVARPSCINAISSIRKSVTSFSRVSQMVCPSPASRPVPSFRPNVA